MTRDLRCPQCDSERLWKDGLRYLEDGSTVQRWLCRDCGYRFSDPNHKPKNDSTGGYLQKTPPSPFKNLDSLPYGCRVGAASTGGAKNLAKVETRHEKARREGTEQTADIKGKLVEFMWFLKKKGYKSARNRFNMVKRLVDLGADLWDPESVKELFAAEEKPQKDWSDGYRMLMCYAYENFLEMEGLTWERPVYKQEETLPFIPLEQELDDLITAVGKKVGTFLQGLKDTGADPGELAKLKWTDINYKSCTVNIKPVKGHRPRIGKVSKKFIERLKAISNDKGEYIFNYESLRSGFQKSRKNAVRKLGNPRLGKITFTTFRHWKGTMEYHRTKDILHVKRLLGHKEIKSTMKYINLEATMYDEKPEDFHVKVAHNIEEAVKLVEVGFEYVTGEYNDGGKIFRKRK